MELLQYTYLIIFFGFFAGIITAFSLGENELGGGLIAGYFLYPWVWEPILMIIYRIKNCCTKRPYIDPFDDLSRRGSNLVYHPKYNMKLCGIEKHHPFDSCKYERVINFLNNDHGIVLLPDQPSEINLDKSRTFIYIKSSKWYKAFEYNNKQDFSKQYHTPTDVDYAYIYSNVSLLHLILLNYSIYISKIVEMPICFFPTCILRISLLRGFLLATQGTIMSANMAMRRKRVIHVGGGLHHAHFKGGSGFCCYNDIGLACKYLLDYYPNKVKKILIIDLDAHQGNGHERDKEILGDSLIIADMYNPRIFPNDNHAKKFIDFQKLLYSEDSSKDYLTKLREMINEIDE